MKGRKISFVFLALLMTIVFGVMTANAAYDIAVDSVTGTIFDSDGVTPMAVGNALQWIDAGANGTVDPAGPAGVVTGDDTVLVSALVGDVTGVAGTVFFSVTGDTGAVTAFLRVFDAATPGAAANYGNSALTNVVANVVPSPPDTYSLTDLSANQVVPVPPVANFTGTPLAGDAPLQVVFTDSSTNTPTAWGWTFGDGGTSAVQSPTYTYNVPGTYSVTLVATNSGGFDTLTRTDYVTVTAPPGPPTAEFSPSATQIGIGQNVVFTDQSTNAPTAWAWTFGDGGTSAVQNPTHTYNAAGTFTVSLTATNLQGSGTETKANLIQVVGLPGATFTQSARSGDVPFTVTFTDTSTGAPTAWAWDFGDGVGTSAMQNPVYVYNVPGTYDVVLTVTNVAGPDTLTRTNWITATVGPPDADFTSNVVAGAVPLTVNFTDASQGYNIGAWAWNFGDGQTSTAQNPAHTYTAAGQYTVSLTVTDQPGQTGSETKAGYIKVYDAKAFTGIIQNSADNTVIAGATVALTRPSNLAGAATTTTTIADGSWTLNLPNTGAVYTFKASAAGFISKSFTSTQLAAATNGIIQLTPAGAQIVGTVTPAPVIPATVTALSKPADKVVGSEITAAGGAYNMGVSAANAVALTYTVGAVEPGNPGRVGKTTVAGPLPVTQTTANINTVAIANNFIDGELGGFSDTINLAGFNIPIVQVTAGTIGADATVSFTQVANPDPTNVFVAGSGLNLYEITVSQALTGAIIITLPFDLTQVNPGDFETGIARVNKAASIDDLLNEAGTFVSVPVADIISVDYIGDGTTGLVEFRVSSLSFFGIGVPGGQPVPAGDGDDFCFITSSAQKAPAGLVSGLLVVAGIAFIGLFLVRRKSN